MDRIGLKTMLLLAIALGGMLEVIKRVSWLEIGKQNTAEINASTPFSARPYARGKMNEVETPHHQVRQTSIPRPTQAVPPRLHIPPRLQGQFDAHVASAVANKQQKAQTQDKKKIADKPVTKEKKCKPKAPSYEQQILMAQALADSQPEKDPTKSDEDKAKTDTQAENAETQEEECKEDEQVAENKEGDDEHDGNEPDDDRLVTTANPPTFSGGILTERPQGNQLPGLEEWKARLLNQPNFKETVRLIEAAQSGQISSVLFHQLVDLMLNDPRDAIRELGVLAAGRTPSYESFHQLVKVLKRETFGSRLRARAETELNSYERPTFLPILDQVLRQSSDVFAVIWATRQLEDSARTYLTAKYNRPPAAGQPPKKHPYVATYERFLTVLRELASTPGHREQSTQAQQTLTSLQDLIRGVS